MTGRKLRVWQFMPLMRGRERSAARFRQGDYDRREPDRLVTGAVLKRLFAEGAAAAQGRRFDGENVLHVRFPFRPAFLKLESGAQFVRVSEIAVNVRRNPCAAFFRCAIGRDRRGGNGLRDFVGLADGSGVQLDLQRKAMFAVKRGLPAAELVIGAGTIRKREFVGFARLRIENPPNALIRVFPEDVFRSLGGGAVGAGIVLRLISAIGERRELNAELVARGGQDFHAKEAGSVRRNTAGERGGAVKGQSLRLVHALTGLQN